MIRWLKTYKGPIALVVIVLSIGWAVLQFGQGALWGSDASNNAIKIPSDLLGGTTTTEEHLSRSFFVSGQCLTWKAPDKTGERDTEIVDCDKDHLAEVVQSVEIKRSGEYPSLDEWNKITDEYCDSQVVKYVGYPIIDGGQFISSALTPTSIGWKRGDRSMTCALGMANHSTESAEWEPFNGRIKGRDQSFSYGVGSCLNAGKSSRYLRVSCSRPHQYLVVGFETETVNGSTMSDALFNMCVADVKKQLGRTMQSNESMHALQIEKALWDAGYHKTDCILELAH